MIYGQPRGWRAGQAARMVKGSDCIWDEGYRHMPSQNEFTLRLCDVGKRLHSHTTHHPHHHPVESVFTPNNIFTAASKFTSAQRFWIADVHNRSIRSFVRPSILNWWSREKQPHDDDALAYCPQYYYENLGLPFPHNGFGLSTTSTWVIPSIAIVILLGLLDSNPSIPSLLDWLIRTTVKWFG